MRWAYLWSHQEVTSPAPMYPPHHSSTTPSLISPAPALGRLCPCSPLSLHHSVICPSQRCLVFVFYVSGILQIKALTSGSFGSSCLWDAAALLGLAVVCSSSFLETVPLYHSSQVLFYCSWTFGLFPGGGSQTMLLATVLLVFWCMPARGSLEYELRNLTSGVQGIRNLHCLPGILLFQFTLPPAIKKSSTFGSTFLPTLGIIRFFFSLLSTWWVYGFNALLANH